MPNREIRLRLWTLLLAFAAITASGIIGLYALTEQSKETHRLAARADTLASQLATTSKATRAIRKRQLRSLHNVAVTSCASRHKLTVAVLLLGTSLRAAEATAIAQARQIERTGGRFPGLTKAQTDAALANADKLVHNLDRAKGLAKRADCRTVPPLTPKVSPKKR